MQSIANFEESPHLPYPFRFSDTSVNNSSFRTQPSQNRTIPRKPPTPLPPLSKGGGLTAMHKPLYCCFLLVPRPPFLFTKPFCRQDGGIASPPSLRTTFLPPLVKGEVLSPEKIRATTGGIVTLTFAPHPTLAKPHYPTRFSWCECDSPTSHKNKIRPRFHGGELISISLSGVWGIAPSRVRATAPLPTKKIRPRFHGGELIKSLIYKY